MATTSSVRGVSRVVEKLENSVKNGNYYEAHQMYRTLYFRYLAQKKFKEALDLLYKGSLLFLEHDQQISGADLAILLVDVLVKSGNDDYEGWIPKLSKIFSQISPSTPERETFLAQALRWSSNHRTSFGHPILHQNIARVYWTEKNYCQARHHYIYSKDGQSCAKLLIEFQMVKGFKQEADLFIAQAVLQYLCLSNKSTADQTFRSYTEQHPRIKRAGPPYLLPLLNFIFFLLQAIESRKIQTFAVLCEQYEPSIKRDPCYVGYLDKIGQIFFGVQPGPTHKNSGGFFGNLFESLMQGLAGSDDESSSNEDDNNLANNASKNLARGGANNSAAAASTSSSNNSSSTTNPFVHSQSEVD